MANNNNNNNNNISPIMTLPTQEDMDSSSISISSSSDSSSGSSMIVIASSQFGVADYAVFVVMLLVSIGVGVFSAFRYGGGGGGGGSGGGGGGRQGPSVLDFLTGSKSLPALPVALSLLGGVISALSILGNATEIYLYGTQLCMNMFGAVIALFLYHTFILPLLFNLNLVSIIKYLELRFDSIVLRKLATSCQLLSMFFFLGICLYAPSLALTSATNFPAWASVVCLGVICTIYVTIGGVRAVVYTDVIQTTLMFVGVLVVVVKVIVDMGGLRNIWEAALEGNRIEFFNMNTSPYIRHTFWSTNVLGFYFILSSLGLSQPQYQRLTSVKTLADGKW
ncbi:hypothetical protein Pcinc_015641 [Petrolisthes cinctipes]|uniref:Sodium-dependent multivitamin transporter n=1 Tax=Petrolisthes cinctipes TaxID=88211 RepID=A0AAE1KPI9_PETCI|nr:hypothetical protein Pcinc_015641 [Petrolisthes cinctipes]